MFCEAVEGDVIRVLQDGNCELRTGQELPVINDSCGKPYVECSCGAWMFMGELSLHQFEVVKKSGPW